MASQRQTYMLLLLAIVCFTMNAAADGEVSAAMSDGIFIHEPGYCMWYDQCGTDSTTQKPLNCLYNKPAPLLNDSKGLEILKELCPEMVAEDENATRTCCATSQLLTFQGNMKLPEETMGRCPSCYKNLVTLYCHLTCSTNQSMFVNATTTLPYPGFDSGSDDVSAMSNRSISEVDYYVLNDTAQEMFNSCKNVNFPSSNTKVLSLYCGQYGAEHCTAQRWLDFMGDKTNQQTPFQINFNLSSPPESMESMETKVYSCQEAISNDTQPCSCQDCPASCPPLPPPPATKPPFLIFGVDGYMVIFTAAYGVFVIFFCTVNILTLCCCKQRSDGSRGECCDENSTSINSVNETGTTSQISEDDVGCKASCGLAFQRLLELLFQKIGTAVAAHPHVVIVLGVMVVTGMSVGFIKLQITTDPVQLWSPPDSESRLEKNYFDEHFGPFYRTEQLILTAPTRKPYNYTRDLPVTTTMEFSGIIDLDILHQVLDLQTEILNLQVPYGNDSYITLSDICYKPLAPQNDHCTIQSVVNYFQNSHENLDKKAMGPYGWQLAADYHDHILSCAGAPNSLNDTTALLMPCLGTYGGPIFPWTALGGFEGDKYNMADSLIITFPVNNYLASDPRLDMAMAWEKEYIEFVKNYSNPNLTIAFQAERSVEDEINRESSSDVVTIAASYMLMFAYVTFALGQINSCQRLLIDSKIILGLSGVIIVLMSVSSSIGVLSWAGIPATLIVIEVVPFLVLAVGVDNIFILVQRYQRDQRFPAESRAEHIGRVLGEVAPSMLLTSSSESIAFGLGAMSSMPAVRAFSMYAAVAVAMDFLLQITCFVAVMALDSSRQEANRYEILCCASNKHAGKQPKEPGILYRVVKNYYAPFLLTKCVRILVILVFSFLLCAAGALIPHLSVGLDQKLSMPEDSYMVKYFEAQGSLLNVGPPVYFVVREGYNYTTLEGQNKICGGTGCNENSLTSQVYFASEQADYTNIAHPTSSWMDDFFDWVKPTGALTCCRVNASGDFCPATDLNDTCTSCRPLSQKNDRPTPMQFEEFLPFFLEDIPGTACSKGGKAAYASALNFTDKTQKDIASSYFMTYHTTMRNSSTFISALKNAREIGVNITTMLNQTIDGFNVFPYSIFYVYYEQYLTIVHETAVSLGIVIAAVFGVTFILLAFELVAAFISTLTIAMITLDIMGMMVLWGIELNAISLVNLIMSVGISVEFCSHIVRGFTVSTKRTRLERAEDALAHIGSSVLSGITLTKAFGIIILAFSHSQLFKVYYFRMYLGMVIFGAAHGLIFLPVFLSYIGPSVSKAQLLEEQERSHGRVRRGGDNEHLIPSRDSQGYFYA
ncbi:NPC intracellular cholesterol transporter 1-like [Diadema antillarum]|uniref:NPC intracellular cholesterol transporter 1-like n=1 Tax=Diadema antillarum TaxID=105358 RepID=UPI003A88B866